MIITSVMGLPVAVTYDPDTRVWSFEIDLTEVSAELSITGTPEDDALYGAWLATVTPPTITCEVQG